MQLFVLVCSSDNTDFANVIFRISYFGKGVGNLQHLIDFEIFIILQLSVRQIINA